MSIHNSNHTQKWRQKWELNVNGKNTGEYFHSWHNTKDEAYTFVCRYIKGLGNSLPEKYYRPFGAPHEHSNLKNEPIALFIKHGAITLAPI